MDHFGGLDVSVKETSICIVDDTGRIVKEVKVASEPACPLKDLGNPTYRFKRIGLEAGRYRNGYPATVTCATIPGFRTAPSGRLTNLAHYLSRACL